jgi:sugar phosphate isomerase/epimerase
MAGTATIIPGLASVSFRRLIPPKVAELARRAGVGGIEWGGDIHVPHGDLELARRVARLTLDHGLAVAGYASYYRIGASEREGLAFEKVLATARALQAPRIRVWAGLKPSAEADESYRRWIADETRRVVSLAAAAGIKIAFEPRHGTLADTLWSINRLLEQAAHPDLQFLWQPAGGKTVAYNLQTLTAVLPRLADFHVFHRWPDDAVRHPLSAGERDWRQYLHVLPAGAGPRFALLKFFKDDSPEQFLADAMTLKSWLPAG